MSHDDTDSYERPERRGGARPGTGPKPAGYVKSSDLQKLDAAKARKEAALASKHEIELLEMRGEYVPRSAFRDASATLLAELVQGLRGIPDMLERRHGLTFAQAQAVETDVNAALETMRKGLQKLLGDTPIPPAEAEEDTDEV